MDYNTSYQQQNRQNNSNTDLENVVDTIDTGLDVVDLVNPDLLSSATDIASNVLEGAGSVAEAAGTGVGFIFELLGGLG